MKQFSDLSPASKALVIGLFCRAKGYQALIPNIPDPRNPTPNPETPTQFAQRWMQEYLVREALLQRVREQTQVTADTAGSDADL